jgi:hypothetical protein
VAGTSQPIFFGEMVLMLWLVIFGARVKSGVIAAG